MAPTLSNGLNLSILRLKAERWTLRDHLQKNIPLNDGGVPGTYPQNMCVIDHVTKKKHQPANSEAVVFGGGMILN